MTAVPAIDSPRGRAADVVVFAAFAAVPLLSSAAFLDQYTTVKWYAVHALASAWLLAELWACRSRGWPAFVRAHAAIVIGAVLLATWSAFRGGPAWALQPMADRVACAIVVLCASWYFARNRGRTTAVVMGTAASAALTIALGLAQAAGAPLPAAMGAREGPAAAFGNFNMAAQFVGLALVLVLATPPLAMGRGRRAWDAFRVVLALGGAAHLYVLSARSVLIALVAAALALGWRRRRAPALLAAAVAATLLALAWLHPGARLDQSLAERKASSIGLRLALWTDTLALIRDRPLGVGAGNFEYAFLPRQARLPPQEEIVFKSPHDEYLRYLAEDGALFVLAAAALALLLVARWRTAAPPPPLRALVVGWTSFLAVEAAFQFPLALAMGALAASVALGGALAAAEPVPAVVGTAPPRRPWWLALGTVVALALAAASLRIATSERLFVRFPDDEPALARACRLDPRNLPACVTAAWLEARAGDHAAARARIGAVLKDAPGYPPAVKLLGDIALAEGDSAEACRRLGEYDALFHGASASHARAQQACAAARRP